VRKRHDFADALRRAIKDSGQNTLAVANGAGVPNPVLYRFMSGRRGLGLGTIEKLMRYLKLKITKAAE